MSEEKKETKGHLKTAIIIMVTFLVTATTIFGSLAYYVVAVNPFNIQACIITGFLQPGADQKPGEDKKASSSSSVIPEAKVDHPLLSDKQEAILEDAGVDIGALSETISPELEACFVEKLGQKRVSEIMAGSELGTLDVLRGSACLK